MARLCGEDAARIRAIGAELATFRVGGPGGLELAIPALHDVMQTEKTISYTPVPRGDSTVMGATHAVNVDVPRMRKLMDALTQSVPVKWTMYNAFRPEGWQRNRVLTRREIESIGGVLTSQAPVTANVLAPMGVAEHDQLRVLLCDGPSLLGWLGSWQPDGFDSRQRAVFSAVAPMLKRRLCLERDFASMPRTIAALAAALAAIGAPAFVASRSGQIFEANEAGRALHARNPRELVAALRDSIARRPSSTRFTLTPLVGAGEAACYLAVAQADTRALRFSTAVASVSSRWGLTPRQCELLDLVARGMTNRTISATLSIAESTVEFHLALIFDKAGVETRAALIALFVGA